MTHVLHVLVPATTWSMAPGAMPGGPSIVERLGLPHPEHVTVGPSLFRIRDDVGAVVDLELRGLRVVDGDYEAGIGPAREILAAER